MNIPQIDYYLVTLLKRNSLYIVCFIFFIYLAFVLMPQRFTQYKTLQENTQLLKAETAHLFQQQTIVAKYTPSEIDELVRVVNTAVPEKYDPFTIYGAIDELERNSGLKFTQYTAPFAGAGPQGVTIGIDAQGPASTIINFLENYKTIGGRIIDIDNITIKPSNSTIHFTAVFLSFPFSKSSTNLQAIRPEILQELKEIQRRVEVLPSEPEEKIVPKQNPFSP